MEAVIEPIRLVGSHLVVTDDRLGELFRAHGADALRLAYVMTGSREAAEDITQDAFVRIGRVNQVVDERPSRLNGVASTSQITLAHGACGE